MFDLLNNLPSKVNGILFVSIHKWPFSHWAVFSVGFRLQCTARKPRRKPVCGLAHRKIFTFVNWTLNNAIYMSWMGVKLIFDMGYGQSLFSLAGFFPLPDTH